MLRNFWCVGLDMVRIESFWIISMLRETLVSFETDEQEELDKVGSLMTSSPLKLVAMSSAYLTTIVT